MIDWLHGKAPGYPNPTLYLPAAVAVSGGLDWWSLGKSGAVLLGLGAVLALLDWLTNPFPGWSAPVIGVLIGISVLSFWAVYRLHVEKRIPDNRAALIEAIYRLRTISADLIGSYRFIAHAKASLEKRGQSTDHLAFGADRLQEYLDAKHKLELEELIAGPDFKAILEIYRMQIEVKTEMCADESLADEEYLKAREEVRELADKAIEMLDEGRLYFPKRLLMLANS